MGSFYIVSWYRDLLSFYSKNLFLRFQPTEILSPHTKQLRKYFERSHNIKWVIVRIVATLPIDLAMTMPIDLATFQKPFCSWYCHIFPWKNVSLQVFFCETGGHSGLECIASILMMLLFLEEGYTFKDFVSNVLEVCRQAHILSSQSQTLHWLKISWIQDYLPEELGYWISMLSTETIQELDLHLEPRSISRLPYNIFYGSKLVNLKLEGWIVIDTQNYFVFSSLKILELNVLYKMEDSLTTFLYSSPVI